MGRSSVRSRSRRRESSKHQWNVSDVNAGRKRQDSVIFWTLPNGEERRRERCSRVGASHSSSLLVRHLTNGAGAVRTPPCKRYESRKMHRLYVTSRVAIISTRRNVPGVEKPLGGIVGRCQGLGVVFEEDGEHGGGDWSC